MAEAVQRDHWSRTSCLLALMYNVAIDPKKTKPAKPADFDPFSPKKKTKPRADDDGKAGFIAMRAVFCPDSLPRPGPPEMTLPPAGAKLIGGGTIPVAPPP